MAKADLDLRKRLQMREVINKEPGAIRQQKDPHPPIISINIIMISITVSSTIVIFITAIVSYIIIITPPQQSLVARSKAWEALLGLYRALSLTAFVTLAIVLNLPGLHLPHI